MSFNSALAISATNLLCVWFRVAALMVHGRRGGFCRDVVVWQHEAMRSRFGVKKWPTNKVGQQMAQVSVGGISFVDCVHQSKDGVNDVPMSIVMGDSVEK